MSNDERYRRAERMLKNLNLMIDAIEASTVLKTYDPTVRHGNFEDLRYMASKLADTVHPDLKATWKRESKKPVLIIRPPTLHPSQYEYLTEVVQKINSFEVIVIPQEYSVTAFIDGQFKNLDSDGDV